MPETRDIADLLEDVQKIVFGLRREKTDLHDQVNRLESQLSLIKEEKTKKIQELQDCNTQLTAELDDTKARLSAELQNSQQKLDRFHPELQSLQDELQNAELQNSLLEIELTKKNQEIQNLEGRLQAFTTLALASVSTEEPLA